MHALAATRGNQSEAARRLGTSRVTLVDKIKKYGLGRAA
jgi:DNA-binding NtrC family response regulator